MTGEARLYRYPADLARLDLLRLRLASLSSMAGQRLDALGGGSGDPVGERAAIADALEREIAALEARVRPVESLLKWLDGGGDDLRLLGEIVRRKYFQRSRWKEIRWGMAISERTLRRRKQALLRILERWRW